MQGTISLHRIFNSLKTLFGKIFQLAHHNNIVKDKLCRQIKYQAVFQVQMEFLLITKQIVNKLLKCCQKLSYKKHLGKLS